MENQNILIVNASDTEKASFYKKTYKHLALAVLAFIVAETILIKTFPDVEVIEWMFGGRWTSGYSIIGLFWLGTIVCQTN